jgi:hypothetical protein
VLHDFLAARDLQARREAGHLEQFQEKWKPVFRPELRQNKEIERIIDSMKR